MVRDFGLQDELASRRTGCLRAMAAGGYRPRHRQRARQGGSGAPRTQRDRQEHRLLTLAGELSPLADRVTYLGRVRSGVRTSPGRVVMDRPAAELLHDPESLDRVYLRGTGA